MYAKNDKYYAKLIHQDGRFYKYYVHSTIEEAMLEDTLEDIYTKQELKNDGWEIQKNNLQTLTIGDYVERNDGRKRRVLGAQGFGEYRLYELSNTFNDKEYECTATAHDLKEWGYSPVQPDFTTQDEVVEMSVAEIAKELEHDPKSFKVID